MEDRWSYECEDDLEAHGLQLLLERQSLRVIRSPGPGSTITLTCHGLDAARARTFESEVLAKQARDLRRAGEARWLERDSRRDRRLMGLATVGLAMVAAVIVRACI